MEEALGQLKIQFQELKTQLQPYCDEFHSYVQQVPPVQLYVALGIVFFTLLLIIFTRLVRRSKSNTIVLAGLSGSGKTVIFYQLRDGSAHQGTVTSMDPNEGTFVLHSESEKKGKIKPVHVVDVPGHSRLRPKLDEFLPQAAGVVFVVDGLEFLPNCRAASEYLYDILTKSSVVKKKVPVFIFCNKMDKASAHSKEFIRKQLEKEIEKLRASRTAVSDADLTSEITLGIPGQTFAFSQCLNTVTVGDGSGLTGELDQLEQFIRAQANSSKKIKHKHRKVKLAVLQFYKVDDSGKVQRLRKECPNAECGAGTFMANHFDRHYCGKCGLTCVFKAADE